jgi:hypothetical protein
MRRVNKTKDMKIDQFIISVKQIKVSLERMTVSAIEECKIRQRCQRIMR